MTSQDASREATTEGAGKIVTGADYRRSLDDGRRVYFDGQRVRDLAAHPRFATSVAIISESYDRRAQADGSQSSAWSPLAAQPRTTDELRAQIAAVASTESLKDLTETGTYTSLLGLETATGVFDDAHREYAARIRAWVSAARAHGWRCMPTITDAKGDRALSAARQSDPDQYLRIVSRDADGIVLRGAKLHIRGASMIHELVVLPTKPMHAGEEDYAVACAVPANAPGIITLNAHWGVGPEQEGYYPYSRDRAVPVAMVVFEDVFVPHERVFLAGEIEFAGPLVHSFGTWSRVIEASTMAAEADLYVGLGYLLAEANGIEKVPHVREKLTDLIINATIVQAGVEAAIATAEVGRGDVLQPSELYANVAKLYGAVNAPQMMALLHDLAGGSIINAPMPGDIDSPETRAFVEKYMRGRDGVDGIYRTRLMHAARDLTADWFAGQQQILGLLGAGGPFAQRSVARRRYDTRAARRHAQESLGLASGDGGAAG